MVVATSNDHLNDKGEADKGVELDFTCELPLGWETSLLNEVISFSSVSEGTPAEESRQQVNSISWDDAFSRTPPTRLSSNCTVYARPLRSLVDKVFFLLTRNTWPIARYYRRRCDNLGSMC